MSSSVTKRGPLGPQDAHRKRPRNSGPDRDSKLGGGPQTLSEIFHWPQQLFDCLDSDAQHLLVENLNRGLVVQSDFAGMDCVPQSLLYLTDALRATGVPIRPDPVLTYA
eukprot:10143733-Alexandrium_andersonii.AAC.1